MNAKGRRAVFLDRDNTINLDPGYLSDPDAVALLPNVAQALKRLQDAGFVFVVISNQSGVGRGLFGMEELEAVNNRISSLLREQGVTLEHFYLCVHRPDEDCLCRKPKPYLILKARDELGLDLEKSFMVGDRLCDYECGRNAGIHSLLVLTGPHSEKEAEAVPPDDVFPDMPQAVQHILSLKTS